MFAKVLTTVTCLFSVGVAVLIGIQLDQGHVSIFSGFIIGVAIGAPIASIITYLAICKRPSETIDNHRPFQSPMVAMPPQVVHLPTPISHPSIPPVMRQPTSPEPFVMSKKRRVYVIGETGNINELDSDISISRITTTYATHR